MDTAGYRAMVDEAYAAAERQKARVDPMYHDKIDALVDRYARKLAENLNERNVIDARVPSILISGGGNFPVAKKHKQNAARDRNYGEYAEISKLLDKIRSVGMGGISADDDLAVEKLTKKLEGLESLQATMKAVNAYFRKHKTLDGCPELTPEQAEKLKADMAQSWHLDKSKPYAKTRPVFDGYKAARYSKKYLAQHEVELATYRAAKDTMNTILNGAKLPKIEALKKSRRELAGQKKELYAEYRDAQRQMREAVAIKANIDHLLGITDERENKAQER